MTNVGVGRKRPAPIFYFRKELMIGAISAWSAVRKAARCYRPGYLIQHIERRAAGSSWVVPTFAT
jgi:hypothetical protein